MEKKYFYRILLFTFIFLLGIGLVNYAVDPQQQYRYNPNFYEGEQRSINMGLAKNYNYEVVVLGSSTSENILKKILDNLSKKNSVNLSISGSTSYEQRILLKEILKKSTLKEIIYGVDFFSYNREAFETRIDMSNYIYENKLKYLYSVSTLKKSVIILLKEILKKNKKDWINEYNYWGDLFSYSEEKVLTFDNKTQSGNQNIGVVNQSKKGYDYEKMKENFDLFLEMLKEYPEVKCKIYFPPYSSFYWDIVYKFNGLNNILKFKEYVILKTRKNKNIEVYDFQTDSNIINNLNNYKDVVHFGPNINTYIVKDMYGEKKQIVNENNYKKNEVFLKENIRQNRKKYSIILDKIEKEF